VEDRAVSAKTPPPRVRRLDVAERMPFYVIRLSCGHASLARIAPCIAYAVLCGTVMECRWCDEARDV